ncbi:peptidyl-dipeptidase A [Paenibacillus sp. cl6col]|uniref:M3 family metallopeptidase n=1 Tax=Paenibacillus alvei TaxID=44250 RepID=A0ABT4EC38_PAEAL|nr:MULTISPECIES: M3 family metallopeptidase [Paenibacillus]MCY9529926.1 M3 family metallopeptidase [Paenibacillus alvei]SDE78367.1 peptidyl-dipeptidase A [Paenibacillus sp. cl6col]
MDVMDLESFLQRENKILKELSVKIGQAGWMVTSTGEESWNDALEVAQNEWKRYLSDTERFALITKHLENKQLTSLQQRQLTELHHLMINQQLDPQLAERSTRMTKELVDIFNSYRPTIQNQHVSNNDIRTILETSLDPEERKQAWLASKQIGKQVCDRALQLIQQRNEEARTLGYDNYYQMQYSAQDLDLDVVFALIDELLVQSEEPYRLVKQQIDEELAQKFRITVSQLRPWHYSDPFFQSTPAVSEWSMAEYLQNKRMEAITAETFQSMGLNITDVIARSDLYPRDKKYPYGYCTDMGRTGEPRVMMSMNPSEFWMSVMLHEFGHAAYEKNIDAALPFLLRKPAHTLTTEAIAMLFGRMTKDQDWITRFIKPEPTAFASHASALRDTLQREMLVSMRWYITFVKFERELYERPHTNVNERWWQLVEEIQHLQAPEDTRHPDWAAKMHFTLAPVSYQSYILGELTASQLHHYIMTNISRDLFSLEAGTYVKEQVFFPGATWTWNDLLKRATGEPLHPKYFVQQFVSSHCKQ